MSISQKVLVKTSRSEHPEKFTSIVTVIELNHLTPESDQHLIYPYDITTESHIQVTGIKEMITNSRSSRLSNKFSLSAPKKMLREQYGENAYRC